MFSHLIYYSRICFLRGHFYYKLKRPAFTDEEFMLLALVFKKKGKLTNQELFDLFYEPSLDRATIIRLKIKTVNRLQHRIQGMFMCSEPLFQQIPDKNDKRSHTYVFSRRYLAF